MASNSNDQRQRRLAFYKHLISYSLANEIDKFLTSEINDDVDSELLMVVVNGNKSFL
jgi:hypothetical protein